MNKDIFTDKLCEKFSLSRDSLVKKSRKPGVDIYFGDLCSYLYELGTTAEVCAKFNISVKTLRPVLYSTFKINNTGSTGIKWKPELLNILGYRTCSSCRETLSLDSFYNNTTGKSGKGHVCKPCAKQASRQQRIDSPEIIKASNRKRKAIIRGAFTSDANLDLIKRIYKECPTGYHVDHIVPLSKGGLHHENNLCYLPAILNMQKQAKMPEEVPEIMKFAIYPKGLSN